MVESSIQTGRDTLGRLAQNAARQGEHAVHSAEYQVAKALSFLNTRIERLERAVVSS